MCLCVQYMHRRVGHNVSIKKSSAKLAKSREKIDFMLNELEFIHLSISLCTRMLNYTRHGFHCDDKTRASIIAAANIY